MKAPKQPAYFVLNVPNALSLYRILAFPVLLYLVYAKHEATFVILFCISLITDILDGLIARVFKQETEFGARLDSIADVGSYIAGILGLIVFRWTDLAPYIYWFYGLIAFIAATTILPLLRWKRLTSFHLYTSKIAGYIQGIWLFTIFAFGFNPIFYFVMIAATYISEAEHLIIQALLKHPQTNIKGLYWVLKLRKSKEKN